MMAVVPEGPEMNQPPPTTSETFPIATTWPQSRLPQRWAISPWGEARWTYMAMWTPEDLPAEQRKAKKRGVSLAVWFHELGEKTHLEQQLLPRLEDQPWRLLPTSPPREVTGPEMHRPSTREMPAVLPPLPHAVPERFLEAPQPIEAMRRSLREIAGLVFKALEVIPQAHPEAIKALAQPPPASSTSPPRSLPLADPETEALARHDLEDLETLLEEMENGTSWDRASAAWWATLAVRYQSLPQPLVTEVMQQLLGVPIPAQELASIPLAISPQDLSLPSVPPERLHTSTGLPLER